MTLGLLCGGERGVEEGRGRSRKGEGKVEDGSGRVEEGSGRVGDGRERERERKGREGDRESEKSSTSQIFVFVIYERAQGQAQGNDLIGD